MCLKFDSELIVSVLILPALLGLFSLKLSLFQLSDSYTIRSHQSNSSSKDKVRRVCKIGEL